MIVLTSSSAGRQTPESEQRHIERPLFLFRQQYLFHAHYACQHPEYGGCAPDYYLVYLGKQTPSSWEFKLPKPPQDKGQPPAEGMEFTVDVLDTWNMTVAPVAGVFTLKKRDGYFYTDQGGRHVPLSGKPYLAIRIRRVAASNSIRSMQVTRWLASFSANGRR